MPAATTRITDVVASGDEVLFTFTLKNPDGTITGDITGAVLTCSIQPAGSVTNVITDHAMSVLSGAAATCTLTLTEAESVLMAGGADPRATEDYIGDVKMVLSGVTSTFGPFQLSVRSVVGST
jgi:hypothetical protein